jgi:hypothetical protein
VLRQFLTDEHPSMRQYLIYQARNACDEGEVTVLTTLVCASWYR